MAIDQVVRLSPLTLIKMKAAVGLGIESSPAHKARNSWELIVRAIFDVGADLDRISAQVRADATDQRRLAEGRLTHCSHRKELLWQRMLGVSIKR